MVILKTKNFSQVRGLGFLLVSLMMMTIPSHASQFTDPDDSLGVSYDPRVRSYTTEEMNDIRDSLERSGENNALDDKVIERLKELCIYRDPASEGHSEFSGEFGYGCGGSN